MRRIRWLWELRIVLGGLTLLAGREGLGKSTLAVALAAMVTRGTLDGELRGTPRTVIYVDSEDARDYTIVPRLVAADADLHRVVFLDAMVRDENGALSEDAIVLPLDTELLAAAVIEHNAALVVLDAATSVIDSRLDGDKDRQMRQALEAIGRRVGEATGVAVVGIVHFGKRDSADIGKLILGSIVWSQVARSTLAVALDEDTGHLVISRGKGNLGPPPPSLAARITPHTVQTPDGITSVGRIEWLGETAQDARDLLSGSESSDERTERDEAKDWLLAHLAAQGGTAPASDVLKAANRDGIAKTTLHRARRNAGVTTAKNGMTGGWTWSRPDYVPREESTEDSQESTPDARACTMESLEPSGNLPVACHGCGQPLLSGSPVATTARHVDFKAKTRHHDPPTTHTTAPRDAADRALRPPRTRPDHRAAWWSRRRGLPAPSLRRLW